MAQSLSDNSQQPTGCCWLVKSLQISTVSNSDRLSVVVTGCPPESRLLRSSARSQGRDRAPGFGVKAPPNQAMASIRTKHMEGAPYPLLE
jgi:hypothetical protein